MRFSSKINLCVFLAAILLTSACSRGENTNQISNQASNQSSETNSNSVIAAKTDPAELSKIIILPIMPLEAEWREEPPDKQAGSNRAPGPNDRKMTAVLLYAAEDTPKLIALIEKHKSAESNELEVENWFPAELIAQSQTSGNETIKGNAYAANDFLQSPYSNGRITHISGTDYFVLELSTM
jgi:hypothetical protein